MLRDYCISFPCSQRSAMECMWKWFRRRKQCTDISLESNFRKLEQKRTAVDYDSYRVSVTTRVRQRASARFWWHCISTGPLTSDTAASLGFVDFRLNLKFQATFAEGTECCICAMSCVHCVDTHRLTHPATAKEEGVCSVRTALRVYYFHFWSIYRLRWAKLRELRRMTFWQHFRIFEIC